MFMASTPSRADRPLCGDPAAWAEIPVNLNFADLFEFEDSAFAALELLGCQCNTASTSSNNPARTM